VRLDRPGTLTTSIAVLIVASWVLTMSGNILVVTVAQFAVALLVVTMSIHVSRVLHDAVPSTIRSGVVSGVGALSWISFLPFSLVFGHVSKQYGVDTAAWMVTAVAVLAAAVLVKVVGERSDETATDADPCGEAAVDTERVPAISTVGA
jgi:uncharacterized membrane protein